MLGFKGKLHAHAKLALRESPYFQAPTPRISIGDRRQTGLAVISSHLIPLPHDSLRVGERGFDQVVTQLHQLTGPITPACDRYVQYLLAGANPSVLNRHQRGLHP
jgi:hypothetical protein